MGFWSQTWLRYWLCHFITVWDTGQSPTHVNLVLHRFCYKDWIWWHKYDAWHIDDNPLIPSQSPPLFPHTTFPSLDAVTTSTNQQPQRWHSSSLAYPQTPCSTLYLNVSRGCSLKFCLNDLILVVGAEKKQMSAFAGGDGVPVAENAVHP